MDTFEAAQLSRQFERIGARLKVVSAEGTGGRGRGEAEPFTLDVAAVGGGRGSRHESYILRVRPEVYPALNLLVLDAQPKLRHLLLLARAPVSVGTGDGTAGVATPAEPRSRFLCGHDERHWFVAAVKSGQDAPTGVGEAMESLKPSGVSRVQHQLGVPTRHWNRRRNAAFQRQGEWFFLPSSFAPPELLVLRNEAIRRSSDGKPHLVESLYRNGGEAVYVCPQRPQGLTHRQYQKLLADRPSARAWGWRAMRRDMQVYARGRIRHPDHATIMLDGWHQVVMSGEVLSKRVAFLD
ncbi:MAG: hypothetical protein H7Z41_04095 [Cytophagales bacterium]|nr:hypothetical protein [Armatimonadota bacterium]